jgi:hypothetical protein
MYVPRLNQRVIGAATVLMLAGCSSLLPDAKVDTRSDWRSFAEAEAAVRQVIPMRTTEAELKGLGFDPLAKPNVVLLNYAEILRRFLPAGARWADVQDEGLRMCLAAASACRGIEVNVSGEFHERVGGFWRDFFNFSRQSFITGWRFNAILLIKDGVVVYRTWGGEPRIERDEQTHNPLGPLQNLGDWVPRR